MAIIDNTALEMPMVALRGLVVFPNITLHFDVGRKKSIAAVKAAMVSKRDVFLVTQKNMSEEIGGLDSVFPMGVVCAVKQIIRLPSANCIRVVIEGKYRAGLVSISGTSPYLSAQVKPVVSKALRAGLELQAQAAVRHVKTLFDSYSAVSPKLPPDVPEGVYVRNEAGDLADYIAANIPLDIFIKQQILEELHPVKRLEVLCVILTREIQLLNLEADISDKVQEQIDDNQREYYLREQMKVISSELNEGESPATEAENYRSKIQALHLEPESEEKLLTECDRLKYMQASSPESTVVRNYLDKILELPWHKYSKDNLNLENAEKVLSRDHYGLTEVKDRIIELLAVRKLSPEIKGQIICLVGPPGVGKTSIARSLAKAMNRKYARISLGGVHDEAEIRGHRKTYIGSMPGSIIDAVLRTKKANPLILLDEVDKLASDYKGDPSSALLEVLDPEQNSTFRDHYIEIPFDLSKVLFVTTANDRNQIPAPLLDRMDIIELYSYTHEEKFHIAKKYLIPKQLKQSGIKGTQLRFTDEAIRAVIDGYTREAGVRTLERTFAKIMRKQAVRFASGFTGKITVKPDSLEAILGPRKYKAEYASAIDEIGVVNGLAWTSVGGEVLKVEAVKMHGTGKLEITGSLGDVMKESVRTAYSYIRSISDTLPIDADFYKNTDIHIHFPEGAVPKDGPSAGIAITTALVSALAQLPVRANVAMTGEVTLTGRVLPIGGLKEKTMAAYRSGVKTVIIPDENLPDLQKIDAEVMKNLEFISVSHVKEVLKTALTEMHDSEKTIKDMSMDTKLQPAGSVWRQN